MVARSLTLLLFGGGVLLVGGSIHANVALWLEAAVGLMLLLLGDGERGFAITIRAMAYGNTPTLLGVIPICGSLVGAIWALAVIRIWPQR